MDPPAPDIDRTARLRSAATPAPWSLQLLGAVEARHGERVVARWPARAVVALLARLALAPRRAHAREELIELLWPGVTLDVGRNRLRQVLSTLKKLLETQGEPSRMQPVLTADRNAVRLLPGALTCDAVEFERLVRQGAMAEARSLYGGELMPGFYDEWVLEARAHLAALHERAEAAEAAEAATPMPAAFPLPASWTRVFGIELTASRLLALLRHERLLTVTGPGGCGKTRLALEAARALRDVPPWLADAGIDARAHGVDRFRTIAFVALTSCHDADTLLATLAHALGVSGRDLLQQIQARLAGAPTLLVLDNFEQLVGTSAQTLLLSLLEALPALHLLVTSRLRLGLPGEQVFVLGGLPLPDTAATAGPEAALLNPAVALFVDRARAARADFQPDPATLADICELVRWLGGMPLALELAASRVASFTPVRMLQLLSSADASDAHLRLLARSGPRAGHDPRHASMAEVIDWSWRLLTPDDQLLLAALSAGVGESGVPALAAMVGRAEADVAARLDDLAGHSMLHLTSGPSAEPRFAMLEPVREFVRQRRSADERAGFQRSELDWLLRCASGLGVDVAAPLASAESRNIGAALANPALDPVARWRLALALSPAWETRGMPAALQSALEQALQQLPDASTPIADATDDSYARLACQGHELLCQLRHASGFAADALHHADQSLRLAGNDPSLRARALARRAWVELAGGIADADIDPVQQRLDSWLQQAQALAESAGDRDALARVLNERARLVSQVQGDWAGAEVLLARAQALWLELGDQRMADGRLYNRARCWARLGRQREAMACFERYGRLAGDAGNVGGQIDALLSLSTLLSMQRRWTDALHVDRQCVHLCWQHWHRSGLAFALWNLAHSVAHLRHPGAALPLMAFVCSHWERNFGPLTSAERQTADALRRLAQARLGRERAHALWDDGLRLSLADAVAQALETSA